MAQSARYAIALLSARVRCTKYTIAKGRSLFSNLEKLIKTGTRKIFIGKILLLVLKSAIAFPMVSRWFAITQSTAFQEAIALLKP